ncbi:MAG: cytochrome c family protein [Rhodospirillaceae bacterium]
MRKVTMFGLGLAAAVGMMTSGAAYAGDAAAGEKVFKKYCMACHTVEAGKNRVGPSLHGIVGRQSASVAGFAYSAAVKGLNVAWNEEKLGQWLEGPAKMAPGTKMTFSGVKDATERADLIAYLATQK